MDNIPKFCSVKSGAEKPDYLHPCLEGILTETYGVIVYQEQVMQIAQVMAGYSLGDADLLRRAMGKKKKRLMSGFRSDFVNGAKEKSIDEKSAIAIFELLEKFAEYGFNKMLFLRGGYRSGYDEEGLTFGGGLSYSLSNMTVNIDYAYLDYGRLGNTSVMSIGLGF